MIQRINSYTVRLVPDTPAKRPTKKLNWLEQQMVSAVKSAVQKEMQGHIFFRRQLALADRYQDAVELRNKLKCVGLPGFMSVPVVACKVVRPR